jgi:predicted nucleic acid-binding protein
MIQPVVSNAGPLLVLAKLNILYLLKHLYRHVHIPQAVYDETVVAGLHQGYEDAHNLKLFLNQENWLPATVLIPTDVAALPLDRGEQESLALALHKNG